MRRLLITVALLALSASTAFAQLRVIPDEGMLAGVVTSNEPGKWVVFGEGYLPVQPTVADGGKLIYFQGPPGLYGIVFFPEGDGQPFISRLVLGGLPPVPPPDPDDGDDDDDDSDPNGVEGPYRIMLFFDKEQLRGMSKEQAAVLNGLVLRKKLEAGGHVFVEVLEASALQKSVPIEFKPFVDSILGDSLPRVAFLSKDGTKILDMPLPGSPEDMEYVVANLAEATEWEAVK